VRGHLEGEEEEGQAEDGPVALALHLDLEVLERLHHHGVHLALDQSVHLDGVDPAEDRPVGQVQEYSDQLRVLLAFHDLEGAVDVFLLEDEVVVALTLRLLLRRLHLLRLLQEGAEGVAVRRLLLRTDGEDARGELLVILLEEGGDFRQFCADGRLQLLEDLEGEFDLREGEVEDARLVDDLGVLLLAVQHAGGVPEFVVEFPAEVLVEGEDVSLLDAGDVEAEYLEVDFLLLSLLFLLLLGRRSSLVVVNFLLELHGLEVEHLQHLARHRLVLHLLRLRVVGSLRYYGDRVRVQSAVQTTLDDLAVLQRVLLQDLVDVLLRRLHAQVF
jgi:hypothetical protein